MAVERKERLCNEVDIVWQFMYLSEAVSTSGGC